MKKSLAVAAILMFAVCGFAQVSGKQNTGAAQTKPESVTEDISGMYTFLQEGEFVQITVEDRTMVTGFISRYGELPSDKGAFLDQFIRKGTLENRKLAFTSDPLHGVWYEFRGTVERGPGKAPGDEAYWLLKGTLIRHTTDADHKDQATSRDVMFKSFPQDAVLDKPRRD
jgi:hypothetical protein